MSLQTQPNEFKSTSTQPKETIRRVPTLSLRDYTHGSEEQKNQFILGLFNGIKDYGFIILKDHPVRAELITRAYEILEAFYKLPTETKRKYVSPKVGGQKGYTPFGKEHAKDASVMDLKEFYHVGRETETEKNIWPTEMPEFKLIFSQLYADLEKAGMIMMEALTGPLHVEKDFFSKMVTGGVSILRLLHYPPIPDGVDPRCLRAAPHEDINFITLLPAATASGLQLKDRNGEWLDIVSENNTLIVDAGDMLARLTNDVIPSTTHQVVNTEEGRFKSRYSMPFFMHPRPEASLACLQSCQGDNAKYPPITAGDFLTQRLIEIGLIPKT
ncbi:MAG: isopenicillin N synthase family oxygenase [Bdellovibrionaceae bacterium]|nr:isopenicillin N synthase family oxygenase [Pseudobdellovibrionaceae bacterium]